MKTNILNIIAFVLLWSVSGSMVAQESVRAAQFNRGQSANVEDARWSRIVYRYLDLAKEKNSPLYYPVQPEGGRVNLFTKIFNLLADNTISAYEYLDGRELFTDEYKIDFMEFINRFGIYHRIDNGKIVVEDVDVPSNEVQGYFVKEAYYFDSVTSDYKIKTIAICPVLIRQDDYDANSVRYPLFWISYDDITPYIKSMPIMLSGINNSMTGTVDDFFSKRSYDGEIYKAANPRNLSISQYSATAEEVEKEQERIEHQLRDFEKGLWKEYVDSTKMDVKGKKPKVKKKSVKSSVSSSGSNSMRERRY